MKSTIQPSDGALWEFQRVSPDGNDQSVGLDLGTRDDIPSEPHSISVLHISPAVFQLVILRLIHGGGCEGGSRREVGRENLQVVAFRQ